MVPSNFQPIIESLCRIGLGANNPAFRRQVERLAEMLRNEGHPAEATSIQRLLTKAKKATELIPSKVGVSQAFAGTEIVTQHTAVPTDKETSLPLAEIHFPSEPATPYPILRANVQRAIAGVAEEWQNAERLLEFGVNPAQTCLLYGLPGTGKTQIAYAISDELGLPLVLARLDGLVSSFLGTTARNIANLFQFANRYRCVLLLDEFDAIAKLRDDPHEVGEIKRVVNSILQNLDQRKGRGITIAITNHEQLLDPAIWRRFESRILVPPPEFSAREEIVRKFFQPIPLDQPAEKMLAWATDGMTGADIEALAKSAKRNIALAKQPRLLAALRHCVLTNSSGGSFPNFSKILQSDENLARTLSAQSDLNLTQREIAQLLSMSQAQISRWIRQETAPNESNS